MDFFPVFLLSLPGAGIVQRIILTELLFSRTSKLSRANRILAILMVAFVLNIAHPLFAPLLFEGEAVSAAGWAESFQFLFGPMIFLYVRALTRAQGSFRARDP